MIENFGKEYKLCSQKLIGSIFETKQGVKSYPFILHYKEMELPVRGPFQFVFSVPKRNFKKAHDRNQLKRRMREAYRVNKHQFYTNLLLENRKMIVAFIYTGKKTELYPVIESSILRLSKKFLAR